MAEPGRLISEHTFLTLLSHVIFALETSLDELFPPISQKRKLAYRGDAAGSQGTKLEVFCLLPDVAAAK